MGHRFPVLIGLLLALTACAPAAAPQAVPEILPPVPVANLAGDRLEVSRVAGGRVAIVSLWATWCDACQKEMDALNRLCASAGDEAVVIGVAVGEERGKVADFARRRGLRYVQLVDEDFAFADAVGQRRVPATLVVDRDGRIVFREDALDGAGLDALRRAIGRTL
jgi:thiol-disulfide isomerase/thioredoxin